MYEQPHQKYLRNNFWPNISKDFKTRKIVTTENYTSKIWLSNKEKKSTRCNFAGSTCYIPSFTIHTISTMLFHPFGPGKESILNGTFLIKTLLFSQAEFMTTFNGSDCAFSDYHLTFVCNCSVFGLLAPALWL